MFPGLQVLPTGLKSRFDEELRAAKWLMASEACIHQLNI